jgi:hypothetical protein
MRTLPLKYSAGPLIEGWEALGLTSMFQLHVSCRRFAPPTSRFY